MGKRGAEGLCFVGEVGILTKIVRRGDFARTFAIYEDLCAISVRPHQYCLIVYLFLRQAGFQVDNFKELGAVSLGLILKSLLPVSREALGKEGHTVLVMPSVNRTNSMLFPGPSQSGLRVRISLRADA